MPKMSSPPGCESGQVSGTPPDITKVSDVSDSDNSEAAEPCMRASSEAPMSTVVARSGATGAGASHNVVWLRQQTGHTTCKGRFHESIRQLHHTKTPHQLALRIHVAETKTQHDTPPPKSVPAGQLCFWRLCSGASQMSTLGRQAVLPCASGP